LQLILQVFLQVYWQVEEFNTKCNIRKLQLEECSILDEEYIRFTWMLKNDSNTFTNYLGQQGTVIVDSSRYDNLVSLPDISLQDLPKNHQYLLLTMQGKPLYIAP
jgi:hypothetical protein